jgi:hypothetical protein
MAIVRTLRSPQLADVVTLEPLPSIKITEGARERILMVLIALLGSEIHTIKALEAALKELKFVPVTDETGTTWTNPDASWQQPLLGQASSQFLSAFIPLIQQKLFTHWTEQDLFIPVEGPLADAMVLTCNTNGLLLSSVGESLIYVENGGYHLYGDSAPIRHYTKSKTLK